MQLLKKEPPKKTWRLGRNTVTGQIFTDYNSAVYCGTPTQQQAAIDKAKAAFALDGTRTPDHGRYYSRVPTNYSGPSLHEVELFDHIPVLRGKMKFKHIYNGTSGASIYFTDTHGHDMVLRTSYCDKFFQLVGEGKIVMDGAGFYEFNITFSKGGDKVYMELHGY